MGFVGFLRFSLLCLDFLAWPSIALGYPLWASIRAIETSSKHQMRKLVTYWTIFSFISLFEIFFSRLIEWLPVWAYVKLVAICWLVIPQFSGACLVYQCLIHPCLSVNPQDVINSFSVSKEKLSGEETFLASAEAYIKENGPEALEKLIANKGKHKEHFLADSDALEVVKRVESTEIVAVESTEVVAVESTKIVAAEEPVFPLLLEQPKPSLVQSEKQEIAAAEAQKVTIPAESEEKIPLEIHALRKVQREWTCAMCQVTTTSEATLNSHLGGRKHKDKCEMLLKTCTQTAKNMQSSAVKPKSKFEELKTSTQTENNSKASAVRTYDTNQAKKNLKNSTPGQGSKQATTEKPKSNHINVANLQQMQKKPKNDNAGIVNQQSRLWCGICNIRCPGMIDMDAHLKGRKHALQIQSKIMSLGGGQA